MLVGHREIFWALCQLNRSFMRGVTFRTPYMKYFTATRLSESYFYAAHKLPWPDRPLPHETKSSAAYKVQTLQKEVTERRKSLTISPMSYATFTSTGLGHKVCQRCKVASPPGTKFQFMASLDPSKPGKDLCMECYDYYQSKPTTVHIQSGAPSRMFFLAFSWMIYEFMD